MFYISVLSRNKIVRDLRKSFKTFEFDNSMTRCIKIFVSNAQWNFITIFLLIMLEFKIEHVGVGSFLKCICLIKYKIYEVNILPK